MEYLYPINHQTVKVLTDTQVEFLKLCGKREYDENNQINWSHLVKTSAADNTFPLKIKCIWKTEKDNSIFEISKYSNFKDSKKTEVIGNQIEINNLEVDTTYYWRINNCKYESFKTENVSPRFIEAGGLSNIRDAGNWPTRYNCKIKQGLLYRGSEMNRHHIITEDGIKVLKCDLGIKLDLDLRGEAIGSLKHSPLGEDVNFIIIPVAPYGEFFDENQQDYCKQFFEILCDDKNYPIYYHCWGGADRTGTLAFLIGAVLGMNEQDLIKDYEITTLSIWGERNCHSDLFKSFTSALNRCKGKDIYEKTEGFLESRGVTKELQQKLRDILLE